MTAATFTVRDTCRVCDESQLEPLLQLGERALANAFLRSEAEFADEPRVPLELYLCRACGLVQLLHVVDPEVLFRDYLYVTGTSETMAAHNRDYAAGVVRELGLGTGDLVVEVASNDGSLLQCLRGHGARTLGIEPAANLAELARAEGVETVERFFDPDCAREVRGAHGPARAVIANNVLAHVDAPVEFLGAARHLLAPGGRVIVEVPQLRTLVEGLEYDTVYHEHLSYFSVTVLARAFAEAGLAIERVDPVAVHGGSMRIQAASADEAPGHAASVLALADAERKDGLTGVPRLLAFAAEVERHRGALRAALERERAEGRSLAGYGAPAKSSTLLGYAGIGPELLPYIVDRNPLKVGRFTPGTHVPVLPVETLLERQPSGVLILAWNFAEEIARQQAEYVRRGGRFLHPLPRPHFAG